MVIVNARISLRSTQRTAEITFASLLAHFPYKMGERSREATGTEEMERHTPAYPLPMEIQQMERSETVCRYCGVSYLILHEIQRLKERLEAAEQELEAGRGAAEREKVLQEELLEAHARLTRLEASHLEQVERAKYLDLQLAESEVRLESVSAERDVMEQELGKARHCCQTLRGRSQQQSEALRESLLVLNSCRQELQDVQRNHVHLLSYWQGWSHQLLQTSRDTDAELAELRCAMGGARAEATRLRAELRESDERLASSQTRAQELQSEIQNQKELQAQLQEAQTQVLGMQEKVRFLHDIIQDSQSAKEHMESVLMNKCNKMEELHIRQIQSEKEQRARLSEEQREKEEALLSCQQRCLSLQKELQDWSQREEEMTRQSTQVESENRALRISLQLAQEETATLKERSETDAWAHRCTAQQLAEELKQREQMEALLQKERAHAELRLKETEEKLRMEKEMELQIEMEKNRELRQQCQREADQLRKNLPSLVQAATQELRVEVAAVEGRLREAQEGQEERREQDALRLTELRQEMEQMRRETSVLQEENTLLQETVRLECEERGELTAALTLAREQLLEIRRSPGVPDPRDPRSYTSRRSSGEMSWLSRSGERRGSRLTLPKLPQERRASVCQARISLVGGKKERC